MSPSRCATVLCALVSVFISALPPAVAQDADTPPDWYNISDPPLSISGPDSSLTDLTATYAGDVLQGRIMLVGTVPAGSGQTRTWTWNGASWSLVSTTTTPPLMLEPRLAYDEGSTTVVLCGKDATAWGSPTWIFDGTAWSNAGVQCNWEYGSAMVRAGTSGVLLFNTPGDLRLNTSRTWLWDGASWQSVGCGGTPLIGSLIETSTCSEPSARRSPAMAWQPDLHQVFLFGGFGPPFGDSFTLGDVWTWNTGSNTWTLLTPSGTAPPANGSYGYKMAWDAAHGYFLVVGHAPIAGGPSGATTTLTYALAPDGGGWTWQQLTPAHTLALSDYDGGLPGYWALSEYSAGNYLMAVGTADMNDVLEPWVWAAPDAPLLNQAPSSDAGADQEVACVTPAATSVTFNGTATDATPGTGLVSSWSIQLPSGTTIKASGTAPTVDLPIGLAQALFTTTDGYGLSSTDTTSARVTVQVVGLDAPLDRLVREGTAVPTPDRSVQAGRTLPLKLTLYCAATQLTASLVAAPTIVDYGLVGTAPPTIVADSLMMVSSDSALTFRPSKTGWIYNLDTSRLQPGLWYVKIRMPDGLIYIAQFVLR